MPGTLRDEFNEALSRDQWREVFGGEVSNMCGTLVSGLALTFYKVALGLMQCAGLGVSFGRPSWVETPCMTGNCRKYGFPKIEIQFIL